jgi:hypothetical protein
MQLLRLLYKPLIPSRLNSRSNISLYEFRNSFKEVV